jgi:hypothetical protein
MPYRDLGQSPTKTLGRPTGRVKASAYRPAYHRRQIPAKTPFCLSENGSPEFGPRPSSRSVGCKRRRRNFARSLRPASYCPLRGVIRLLSPRSALGSLPRGRAGDHVRAVECVGRPDPACYNFLYEIKAAPQAPISNLPCPFGRFWQPSTRRSPDRARLSTIAGRRSRMRTFPAPLCPTAQLRVSKDRWWAIRSGYASSRAQPA